MVFSKIFSIQKVMPAKQQVFGFASVIDNEDGTPLIDHDQDVISEFELERAAYNFVLNYRGGEVEHTIGEGSAPVAVLIESFVVTAEKKELLKLQLPRGWWVGFQILDTAVWERVANGELKMFSIGGMAERESVA